MALEWSLLMVLSVTLVSADMRKSLNAADVDELMVILKSSKEHLKELDRELDVISKKLEPNPLVNQSHDLQAQSFVQILEVSRSVDGGEYKFTVQFRHHGDVVQLYWFNATSVIQDIQREVTPELMETSVVIDRDVYRDFIYLNVASSKQEAVILIFNLDQQQPKDVTVSDLVLPVLQIEPSGDIVYQEGSNISVKVTTTLCGTSLPDLMLEAEIIDLTSSETPKDSIKYFRNLIDKKISAESNTSREETILIRTAQYPMSGLLKFQVLCPIYEADFFFVSALQVKILRPTAQVGPYPQNYLNIKDNFNEDNHGEKTMTCHVDEPCRLYCEAVGDDVKEVSLVKISQDGTRTDVVEDDGYDRAYQSISRGLGRLKSAVFTGDIDFYKGTKFECSARNGHGDHVTKNISVFIPPKLVKERSKITVTKTGGESGAVVMSLTCTVKSQTQDSVTFSWIGNSFDLNHLEVAPDVITALPGNEYMATKLVTFDSADEFKKLKFASCSAGGIGSSPYGEFWNFEIPEPI